MKYSKELMERYKKYILTKGVEVSDEEAELHLDSFARLFTAFSKTDEEETH